MGVKISKKNINQIENDNKLILAVKNNDLFHTKNLINRRNADINVIYLPQGSKWNLIHIAAINDSYSVLPYLLKFLDINTFDNYGWNALHLAALNNSINVLEYLILNNYRNIECKTKKKYPGKNLKNKTAYEIADSLNYFKFMDQFKFLENIVLKKKNNF